MRQLCRKGVLLVLLLRSLRSRRHLLLLHRSLRSVLGKPPLGRGAANASGTDAAAGGGIEVLANLLWLVLGLGFDKDVRADLGRRR